MLIQLFDHLLKTYSLALLTKVNPVSINLYSLAHLNVLELELIPFATLLRNNICRCFLI